MKTPICIAVVLLAQLGPLHADSPVVFNLRVSQHLGTGLVDIDYDLSDVGNHPVTISLAVSTTGGFTYDAPATNFSGDLGHGIMSGPGKRIVWDARQDFQGFPPKLYANMRVKVTAQDQSPAPPDMVLIPGGPFEMGDRYHEGGSTEQPLHTVHVSAFYMDRYEVPWALWNSVYTWATNRGYFLFSSAGSAKSATHPVSGIPWHDVLQWCRARSLMEGLTPCYVPIIWDPREVPTSWRIQQGADGYRLPTEAEWEQAARGGHHERFPWGSTDTISHDDANYFSSAVHDYDVSFTRGHHPAYSTGGFPFTSPVGSFAPNGYGLFDMAGNVWEWCWDLYDPAWYTQAGAREQDTRGPASGSGRVIRGGAWNSEAPAARCAARSFCDPSSATNNLGFRCVRAKIGDRTAASEVFEIDLIGEVTVEGKVLDATTRAALSATVTLGNRTTNTTSGRFSFANVSLFGGPMLTATSTGYATYRGTLPAVPGSKSVTVDIALQQNTGPNSNKPIVTLVKPRLPGPFLSGVYMPNEFTASVDWNGLTNGQVSFDANGVWMNNVTGPGPEYVCSLNMGAEPFRPAFDASANSIEVRALSSDDVFSDPFTLNVSIIPLPELIQNLTSNSPLASSNLTSSSPILSSILWDHIGMDFQLPKPALKYIEDLGVAGKFGFEVVVLGSWDYTPKTGEFEVRLGLGAEVKSEDSLRKDVSLYAPGYVRALVIPSENPPPIKLYLGTTEVAGELAARVRGTATPAQGINITNVSGSGKIDGTFLIARVTPTGLIGSGAFSRLGLSSLDNFLDLVSIDIYAKPGIAGKVDYALKPSLAFQSGQLTGKIGLEASYQPSLNVPGLGTVGLTLSVGGEARVTFQLPPPLFKCVCFEGYAEAQAQLFILKYPAKDPLHYVFVRYYHPSDACCLNNDAQHVTPVLLAPADDPAWGPVSRHYLLAGPEGFVATLETPHAIKAPDRLSLSALEAFRQIGKVPAKGSVMHEVAAPGHAFATSGSEPIYSLSQADLTLSTNVMPEATPVLASCGPELLLLYVTDNGSSNSLQFTDIRWTRWDGTNWSLPQTLETNTQAEFAPQVAYDGNGDALAVWERVADTNFNDLDPTNLLTALAAELEIVWSKWSRSTNSWSPPAALTTNNYLDHAPLLCGPMADGSVLLTWTESEENPLLSTNDTGGQVLWAQWTTNSQSWSVPQPLVTNIAHRLSQSLAGVSNRAVYAWTRDLDGELTNATDQQVFYCEWSDGSWGASTQFTTNALGNSNARVAVSPAGDAYLVWRQGSNLVMSVNFAPATSLVRADSQTAGFADYALALGPAGNLVLIWQEMSPDGSDAHYAVYDPVSGTWSKDARLFKDAPLEKSFAPVWDEVGNLTLAYNKVEILKTNKTVTLEDGTPLTISNVPQPGRVDLAVTKRSLIKDLELQAGDLTVSGVNYLPGDPLSLAATVRNAGDVALSNVVVGFYDGHPTNGMVITNVTIPGWLEGATTNVVTAVWVVPEPATNHLLYAVVDSANAITEFNETNNLQAVSIGGTDLTVSLVSYRVETNGALRIIAQVRNAGAPDATNSVIALRRFGETNAPLTTADVPALEPGRLAQVALDLPVGTQPEGEALYTLFADETGVTGDVNTNNNTKTFAVNLWLDTDGDGLPDGWEQRYGLSATNAADALWDNDGDGLSNLAEYRAGTNPTNALSYLRIESISLGGTNGVQMTWGSSSNRLYSVQRASVLSAGGGTFTNLAEHLLSTPPENTFFDLTATNTGPYFYRLKVE